MQCISKTQLKLDQSEPIRVLGYIYTQGKVIIIIQKDCIAALLNTKGFKGKPPYAIVKHLCN